MLENLNSINGTSCCKMSDGKKVCRLCLVEAEVACPIFGSHVNSGVALPQRIMSCAEIKITEDDGLPASICHQCLAQVDKSYQFKLQCERADAMLRKNFQVNDVTISLKKSNGMTVNGYGLASLSSTSDTNASVDHQNNGNNSFNISSNNHGDHDHEGGGNEDDEDDCEDDEDSDVDYGDGVSVPPGIGDSESVDGWEVMKFTPEVIINEEDSKGSGDCNAPQTGGAVSQNGSQGVLRNINSLAEQQLYQLSQVEAILRNHGTEIKVQSGNGVIGNGQSPLQLKLSQQQPGSEPMTVSNSLATDESLRTSSQENGSPKGDYFAAFGVEAVLDDSDSGPASKSRRSRDGEKLFKCRLCPKSYSFSSALSRHKAVHNTMLRPYVCPICKKGFAEPEKLERHGRTHLVDRTWRCNNCGRIFKALNTYERHITTICSYRNKENGGSSLPLPPGLTAHPVNIMPQAVMYRNS